jgi:hypothetical protein
MKVSSPVGDFPFEPVRLTVGSRHLTLEGQVGAWPAKVELEPRDLVSLGRVAGLRFALPAIAALAVMTGLRRRSHRAG